VRNLFIQKLGSHTPLDLDLDLMFSPAASPAPAGARAKEAEPSGGGGPSCGEPLGSNQAFCGVWLPFGWGSGSAGGGGGAESQEEAESIIDSILTGSVLPNYAERVLPQLEVLLDKHGIESVVYLPSKAGGQQPVGKKCMIRSYMDQARVEFRVRSAGELKKMKFDWADIDEMGAGKYADSSSSGSSPVATTAAKKSQANCYMFIKIKDRGTVDLRFESKPLRDATLMGFKLLQVKRSGKLA